VLPVAVVQIWLETVVMVTAVATPINLDVDLAEPFMEMVQSVDKLDTLMLNIIRLVGLVEQHLLLVQSGFLMSIAVSVALVTLVTFLVEVVMALATTTAAAIKLVTVVLVLSALDLNKENNGKVWFNA